MYTSKITITGPLPERDIYVNIVKTNTSQFDFSQITPYPSKFVKIDLEAERQRNLINDLSPEEQRKYLNNHGIVTNSIYCGGLTWCNENWAGWAYDVIAATHCAKYTYYEIIASHSPIVFLIKCSKIFVGLTFELRSENGIVTHNKRFSKGKERDNTMMGVV